MLTDKIMTDYRTADEACALASAALRDAQTKYRARQIGDMEYLVARKAFHAALDAFDAAHRALIDAQDSLHIPAA